MDMTVLTMVSGGIAMSGMLFSLVMAIFRHTRDFAAEYGGHIMIATGLAGFVVFALEL